MEHKFTVTYDYLCPFARNVNASIVRAIGDGASWDVTFAPFSLSQTHRTEGEPDVWATHPLGQDSPSGVVALAWSVAVRDGFPDAFPAFHTAMFDARHVEARDISQVDVVASVAESVGLDASVLSGVVATGLPAKTLGSEHMSLATDLGVFGVPTLIAEGEAVFVRLMSEPSTAELERILQTLEWTNLNEFKRTRVPR